MTANSGRELLILSAGRSTRMGVPKALLALPDGTSWIAHQISCAIATGLFDRITIVVHEALLESMKAIFDNWDQRPKPKILLNPNPSPSGSFDSILAGLKDSAADEIWILPVDCPFPAVSAAIILANAGTGSERAMVPEYQGRSGHPVIVRGITAISELKTSMFGRLDFVLRGWREAGHSVNRVAVDDPGVVTPFNTREEWDAYMNASKSRSSSSQTIVSPSLSSSLPTGAKP